MKIAIFNHPFTDFYSTPSRQHTGTLHLLKELIHREGHEVMLFDVVKNLKRRATIPKELQHITPYLGEDNSPFSFFTGYWMFGAKDNFNHKIFFEYDPDLILISSFAFCYCNPLAEFLLYLKSKTNIPILLGGGGPSAWPEFYLDHTSVDYIVAGPAEKHLIPFLQKFKESSLGSKLFTAEPSDRNCSSSLNEEPLPMLSFTETKKKIILHAQITRGCPHHCDYCSVSLTSGYEFIFTDPDKFLQRLEALFPNNDKDLEIHFEDDNLLADTEKFFYILSTIASKYRNVKVTADNGLDFRFLTKEKIKFLKENNFHTLNLSFISNNVTFLSHLKRDHNVDKFVDVVNEANKAGLQIVVYFISGFPGQSLTEILDILLFLYRLPVLIGISNYYPVPGTKMWDRFHNRIGVTDECERETLPLKMRGTSFTTWGELSPTELITLFYLTRFCNALKRGGDHFILDKCLKEEKLFRILSQEDGLYEEIPLSETATNYFFSRLKEILKSSDKNVFL